MSGHSLVDCATKVTPCNCATDSQKDTVRHCPSYAAKNTGVSRCTVQSKRVWGASETRAVLVPLCRADTCKAQQPLRHLTVGSAPPSCSCLRDTRPVACLLAGIFERCHAVCVSNLEIMFQGIYRRGQDRIKASANATVFVLNFSSANRTSSNIMLSCGPPCCYYG